MDDAVHVDELQDFRRIRVPFLILFSSSTSKSVRDIILKNGFYFIKTKHVKLNQDQAAEFYKEHKGEFVCSFIRSFIRSIIGLAQQLSDQIT